MNKKKNIFFVIVDSLCFTATYGDKRNNMTPNIDNLYNRGMAFTNAIASSTVTTPSMASIFTGNYSNIHGVRALYVDKLNPQTRTFVEDLKSSGYNTYAFVTGLLIKEAGFSKHFDEYNYRDKSEKIYGEWGANFIDRLNKKEFREPWFIFLHLWEVHKPYIVPIKFIKPKYGKTIYEKAVSALDTKLGEIFNSLDTDTIVIFHADHGEQTKENILDELFSYLRFKIYQRFKSKGISLKKFRDIKRDFIGHGLNLYDDTIKVPLIFINKDLFPRGKIIDKLVRQIDIFPTLFDALNINSGLKHTGQSLLPLMHGEEIELDAFIETSGMSTTKKEEWIEGIRTNDYKLIYNSNVQNKDYELYDLRTDQEEKHNIADQKPELIQQLKAKISRLQEGKEQDAKMTKDAEEIMKKKLKDLGYF